MYVEHKGELRRLQGFHLFWHRALWSVHLSDEQDRQIGKILGFPECCVEAWIKWRTPPIDFSKKTGAILGRYRSVEEVDQQRRDILRVLGGSYRALVWLGGQSDPWPVDGTEQMLFVPCHPECSHALALGKYRPPYS